ncbi:MAG TPA: class I SAM-dependent methyltransferase, partial [Acidimicrobiales bacterium]|nr:class I SAM-dependent methyltransferase [Acidimicrobiales bacterium]
MTHTDSEPDQRAFLAQVMAEITDEAKRRRSHDLPAGTERDLDELFLRYSPLSGRGGSVTAALRVVDSNAMVDPVVPVASQHAGGVAVKKGLRSLSLWYMSWITDQVNRFSSGVSRALHLLADQVDDLGRRVDAQRIVAGPVVRDPRAHRSDAWWVDEAVGELTAIPGRVLHAACGNGWLVQRLGAGGIDAYGVDPNSSADGAAEESGTDLRQEPLADHLGAVGADELAGVVLTGVVDGASLGERARLLELVTDRLAPGGTLVVHSLSPDGFDAPDAPVEVDLAPG